MKRTVLAAVEDVSLYKLIRKKLVKSGFKVLGTSTREDAMKLIGKASFDLLLLDVQLSGSSTQEKAYWEQIQRPYLVIAGCEVEKRAVEMMKRGARDYLLVDAGFFSALPETVKKLVKEIDSESALQSSLSALSESDKKFRNILDTMKEPVYICSENHQLQYSNPALQALIGKKSRQKKGYAAVFDSNQSCKHCASSGTPEDESHIRPIEISVDNELRFFQVSVSPINYKKGTVSRLHVLKDISDLIKTKEHMALNEKKLKLLADNAIDMVWQMDLRLKFTYLSPSAETVLGYRMDEMIGRNLWEFARRKDFVSMARHAMGAIRDYKNFTVKTFEAKLLHKNGSVIPVEITGKLLKDEKGKVIGLQGSTKDITERLTAQNEVKEQHNLLRTLIDNIPDMIYVKDLSGQYLINNSGHQKELKVSSQEEILRKTDLHFFDEETAREFYRDEQKIIDSGIPMINKEEFISFKDSPNRWTLTTKVPIRDEHGDVTGIAGINRDITERKEAEDELFKSRHELAIRNKIANVFLTIETDQLYLDILKIILNEFNSPIGCFGYINKEEELICQEISKEGASSGREGEFPLVISKHSWEGVWGKSLQDGRASFSNLDEQHSIAQIPVKNILCVPISVKEEILGQISLGNKPGAFTEQDQKLLEGIAIYIAPLLHSYLKEKEMKEAKEEAFNQLKSAKEKAEESDNLKSAFLLNLSHELRTPLNAILGFTSVLAKQNDSDDGNNYITEQINLAGNDLVKMIEDSMLMAKLESGQIELDPDKQEVAQTLEEVKSGFISKYNEFYPEINIRLQDKSQGISINTDHDKLKSALYNIIDNAVKFSGKNTIELGAIRKNASKVSFYVKDEGTGIPAELHEAVFEKFRKIESVEQVHRGNGLGLSISKALVEKIGGSIQLESEPGEGTCVTIIFPVKG